MKVAILTHPGYRSPRFLAEGLQRMFSRIGVPADCHYSAIPDLFAIANAHASRRNRVSAAWSQVRQWARRLDRYDLIVVSDTVGIIAKTGLLEPLKSLRRPLLHYEVFAYAGSRYFVRQYGPTAHHWFDAFLTVSGIHDDPPLEGPPIFENGMDLPNLAPLRFDRPFSALLDYPRPGYEAQREVQVDALKALNIPYETLAREYSFVEIDQVYSRSAVAFVAFPEAFGVPIVQLQRHGSVIASPNPHWVKRHALRPAGHVFDEAGDAKHFSENFVFYKSADELKQKLVTLRANFSPRAVASRFGLQHESFIHGRLDVLRLAVEKALSNSSFG